MSLDSILTLVTLAIVVYFVAEDWIKALFVGGPPARPTAPAAPQRVQPRRTRLHQFKPRSAQQNAKTAPVNVQPVANVQNDQPADQRLTITPDELKMLARAVELRAAGATKQAALEAAFNVKKGGSAGWQRANELYNAAQHG